ncbi:MAG: multidrug transporter [Nanoarchaeota archaeon]|nr:multidrug transporter [Nanoarchaeota archaeon]
MNSGIKAIFIMVLCTLFTTLGQIFFKLASVNLAFDLVVLLTNQWLYLGGLFYFIGALILVMALKEWDLSFVYPLISISYIWVALTSVIYLGEKMTYFKIGGMLLIMVGIICIGLGSKTKELKRHINKKKTRFSDG